MDDWLANSILELIGYFKKGYASQVTSTVNDIIGRNAKTFDEFANDYADHFR